MFITEIQLKNYRNYEHLELSFEDKVNVIIGENAQGKTNLMEAIYVLAMAKSHRTSNDRELIRWDEDYGNIKGRLQRRNSSLSLELNISKKGKKAKLNHKVTDGDLHHTRLNFCAVTVTARKAAGGAETSTPVVNFSAPSR